MYEQSNKITKETSNVKADLLAWEKVYKKYKVLPKDTEEVKRVKEKLFAEKCNFSLDENFDRVPVKLKRELTDIEIKNNELLLEELLEQACGNTK